MKDRAIQNVILTVLFTWTGIFISCNSLTDDTELQDVSGAKPDLTAMETSLDKLASILPAVMKDPELAKFVYDEAKINAARDEAYAFWDRIADKQTGQGMTLRKGVINQLSKSLGKKTHEDAVTFTADLDAVDNLQVYIHNFDKWCEESSLPATFVYLTIDDTEWEEVILYNPDGSTQLLPIEDEPNYPVTVVGINEMIGVENQGTTLAKQTDYFEDNIYCEWVKLRKGRDIEPWPKGKAEIVVRDYNSSCEEEFNTTASTQDCRYSYEGYLSDGGVVRLSVATYYSSVTFEAFENDVFVDDWIVDKGTVYNRTPIDHDILDEGTFYWCDDNETIPRLEYGFTFEPGDRTVHYCTFND